MVEKFLVEDIEQFRDDLYKHMQNPLEIDTTKMIERIVEERGLIKRVLRGSPEKNGVAPGFDMKHQEAPNPSSVILEPRNSYAEVTDSSITVKGFACALIAKNTNDLYSHEIGYETVATLLTKLSENVEMSMDPVSLDFSSDAIFSAIGNVGKPGLAISSSPMATNVSRTYDVKDFFPGVNIPERSGEAHTQFMTIDWRDNDVIADLSGSSIKRRVQEITCFRVQRERDVHIFDTPVDVDKGRLDIRSTDSSVFLALMNFVQSVGLGSMQIVTDGKAQVKIGSKNKNFGYRLANWDQHFNRVAIPSRAERVVQYAYASGQITNEMMDRLHEIERTQLHISLQAVSMVNGSIKPFIQRLVRLAPVDMIARALRMMLGEETMAERHAMDRPLVSALSSTLLEYIGVSDMKTDFAFKLIYLDAILSGIESFVEAKAYTSDSISTEVDQVEMKGIQVLEPTSVVGFTQFSDDSLKSAIIDESVSDQDDDDSENPFRV
jgi:hypothetical protein